MNKKYSWVYIMTNRFNTVIYIGVTSHLENRVHKHKNKTFEGFTSSYNVNKLVYYELFEDVTSAITREKQLKAWKRHWKIELIKQKNPDLDDLTDSNGNIVDFRYNI